MRSGQQRRRWLGVAVLSFAISIAAQAYATDYPWSGGGTDGNWTTTANWPGGTPSSGTGTTLTFTSNTSNNTSNNNLSGTFTLAKLTFASTLPALHLTGNPLALSGSQGVYQGSPNTVAIDNALSWAATSGTLNLSVPGAGGLVLNGNVTTTGASAVARKYGNGGLTLNGTNSFAGTFTADGGSLAVPAGTLSAANMNIGFSAPSAMDISGNAAVTVSNELDVNYQSTRAGDTSSITLRGGSLTVNGPTYLGRGLMNGPQNLSAVVYQSDGTASLHALTIGSNGTATSLYDISGGSLSVAGAGALSVGGSGNGSLNIHGAGIVSVSANQGLVIGANSVGAASGSVQLSAGTLNVTGNVTLGSAGGMGSFSRSGGVLSATGNLVIGGPSTLLIDDTAQAVPTIFGGTLVQNTPLMPLVVTPQNGHLSTGEAVGFASAPTLTYSTLGPAVVRQISGSDIRGDYLKTTLSGGSYILATASYTSTDFASTTYSSVVTVSGSPTITSNSSAYVMRTSSAASVTISPSKTLTLVGGGIILNGGIVTGGGTLDCSNNTAMIYAGGATAGTISSTLKASGGLMKFGPGTLILANSNASALTGAITVASGALSAQNSGGLGASGSGNSLTVDSGATLELQGGISFPRKAITLNGSGVGASGALRSIGNNSLSGTISLGSNAQISTSDSLTLNGPFQGNYTLTKAGSGGLLLAADSSSMFQGTLTVAGGMVTLQNAGAIGSVGAATVNSGAALAVQGTGSGLNLLAASLNISGAGSGNGALRNLSGSNTLGAVTLSADSQISVDADSLTLGGLISGSYGITKSGSGTLALSNTANSFSGTLSILDGVLSVPGLNLSGTAAVSPIGQNVSPVVLGSDGKTATFLYTGTGTTSGRPFTLAAHGTGAFQVGSALTLSGGVNGGGSLLKTGSGTLTLSGSNPYTGTTTVTAGTLAIDSAGSMVGTTGILVGPGATLAVTSGSTAQLPDAANITLSGGSLSYVANGSLKSGELAGALVLNPGQNNVTLTNAGTGTPYLRFSSGPGTHTKGATVTFNATSSQVQFDTNAPGPDNNIIGGYAFYGSEFATRTTSWPYTVSAYTGYTGGDLSTAPTGSTINAKPTGGSGITTRDFNSLTLTGNVSVSIASGNTLTLDSGGLLGNTTGNISGGYLRGSPSGELVVNTVQNLSISSAIVDNGGATALVKTGPATLTVSGANTFTGDTFLNQGLLEYAPTSDLTYNGVISGVGALKKSGGAKLTLGGTSTYSGPTTLAAGTLWVTGSLGSATTVNVTGGTLGGTGRVGGNVTASGGTLNFPSGSSGGIDGVLTVTGNTTWYDRGTVGTQVVVNNGTLTTSNCLTAQGQGVLVTGAGSLGTANATSTISGNVTYQGTNNSTFTGMIAGATSHVEMNAPGATFTLNPASGSNSYGGGTIVTAGSLKVGQVNALGGDGLTVNGGTLDVAGIGITLPSINGSGGYITDSTTTSGSTLLTINNTGAASVYSGTITKAGTSRYLSLEKDGTGTVTLGKLSYNGDTTVNTGTLKALALTTSGNVYVGSGATFQAGYIEADKLSVAPGGMVILGSPYGNPGGSGAGSSYLSSPTDIAAMDAVDSPILAPASALMIPDRTALVPASATTVPSPAVTVPDSAMSTPEPGTLVLLVGGIVVLLAWRVISRRVRCETLPDKGRGREDAKSSPGSVLRPRPSGFASSLFVFLFGCGRGPQQQ